MGRSECGQWPHGDSCRYIPRAGVLETERACGHSLHFHMRPGLAFQGRCQVALPGEKRLFHDRRSPGPGKLSTALCRKGVLGRESRQELRVEKPTHWNHGSCLPLTCYRPSDGDPTQMLQGAPDSWLWEPNRYQEPSRAGENI